MPNPIFQAMQGGKQGGPANIFQSFKQFMHQNRGKNPNEMIQQMLSSGRINQKQLNKAQQMAQQMEEQLGDMKGMFGF